MMTKSQLASTVLGFHSNMPNLPVVRELLGEDYGTAINLGWLVPDYDTGLVAVTFRRDTLDEMRRLAAEDTTQPPAPQVTNESWRSFGPARTNEREYVIENNVVTESFGTPTPAVGGQDATGIGDDVVVADGGKSYTGTVSGKNPDGTFSVSFGADKPAKTSFKESEMKVTKRAEASKVPSVGAPGAAAPAAKPIGAV